MTNEFRDIFIYLLACAINQIKPEYERVKAVNLKELFHQSKRHSVVAVMAYALEDAGFPKEEIAGFIEEKEKSIRKNILYKNELKEISKFLSENKIWHMPLKGALLMDIYPKIGMRQMADLDIYFDKTYADKVTEFMVSRGYDAVAVNHHLHDVYQKAPFFNIEMHKKLMSPFSPAVVVPYYNNIEKNLLKCKENGFLYGFSPEDYYIYMIAHAAKHYFQGGGTGIRTLLDIYYYLKVLDGKLNFSYIENECKKINIDYFEESAKALANLIFSGNAYTLNENQNTMLNFILTSGTYGYYTNIIIGRINNMNTDNEDISKLKGKYLFKRLFPDYQYMQAYYPAVRNRKYLLPIIWIYRLIYKSITNWKVANKELNALKKIK